ncbi:MogA/MoaB family molybdenum cofactor biosynthesis protein [Salisediminibacterium halotolerans]|uniref:MogA/MoaB family molybdenum cofactor biosynthesis protein n=1 Tax=Salisediminibacterium halotolerans TaxID=517425 RepID=UPI000EB589C4|nr:MogA/MoaB family molybdenum cofactor biosynthesis protein [Salisediminibacterium halotolerans]RLJ77984.1 molybdenum cofactor biosynthesis protein B [Actinophytocola xinjiangensis]RPE88678.1 molybdenum cofactor biosynthesis protein B [Salisediminibacterium halotolerans]TWG36961.1 molybdenum cofactor biosynthesis protein B [Salisediminibacterium halotolerans]GEL08426.1 molybdenum cofactor biosynthesis protein B [Salisediminibacterium halotolerans]
MSVHEHKTEAQQSVACMILTVSDTRTIATDKSGSIIQEKLEESGHQILRREIVQDEYSSIQHWIRYADQKEEIEALIINGGTGITFRDTTFEAVSAMLDKELPGFGELFRYLSFAKDIGPAAMLSRAVAGVRGKTAVFSTPGSSGAVKLAMNELIIPEISHFMREIYKDASP